MADLPMLDEVDVTTSEWALIHAALATHELLAVSTGDQAARESIRRLRRKLDGVRSTP